MGRTRAYCAAEDCLSVRAAWLHFIGGLTQTEVAARLGVSSVKAHRLIMRAQKIGAVRVSVIGNIAECAALEKQFSDRYGLDYCEIVPDIDDTAMPLHELGVAGAAFLEREINSGQCSVIGIGNGRAIASLVSEIPHGNLSGISFVSMLGGLTRNFAANPFDVIHRLAEKTNSPSYAMPVPFFANTSADRNVLLAQRGVQEVLALANRADLILVGIGAVAAGANLVASHVVEPEEIMAVARAGGAGEMLGHFFDSAGQPMRTSLTDRALVPPLESLQGRRVVAIAGGGEKITSISAVLASGYLRGLITSESTARAVLDKDYKREVSTSSDTVQTQAGVVA